MAKHLFGFMYDTALINIVIYAQSIHVYIEQLGRKKIKHATEKIFVLNDSYSDELLYNYIKPFTDDTPYYYVAILDASPEQGAIPTCDKHEMPLFGDLSTAQYICIDNNWACYTSKIFLQEQLQLLGDLGCDFVYSPFVLLKNFYADKIQGKIALYAFVLEHSITIAVFKEERLLFGEYIDTRAEMESQTDMQFSDEEQPQEEESVNLDDIDLSEDDLTLDDELDDLDAFDNIEELDDIESLDDTDAEELLEENLDALSEEMEKSVDETEAIERSSEDYTRFDIIQRSLARFYNDKRFESDFIETLYVADAASLTGDFKRYVQEEMFLNVYVRKIEPELEVCHLVKEELELL